MDKKRFDQNYVLQLFKPSISVIRFDAYDQKISRVYSSSSYWSFMSRVFVNILLCLSCLACGTSPKYNNSGDQSHDSESKIQSGTADLQSSHIKTDLSSSRESKEFEEFPSQLHKTCVQAQTKLYKKAMQSTQEYTQIFMQEMNKLKAHFQGFQLSMRRSQMMIFFGNGLIKRLTMVETIADCLPLYKRYQQDRDAIFRTIEAADISKSL